MMSNIEKEERTRRVGVYTIKEEEDANVEVTYDVLLSSAGEFGLYQAILFLSTFPFYLFGVVAYFQQLFITEVSPNHWCNIPELENLTELQRRTLATPADASSKFGYSQCSAYVANWSDVLEAGITTPDPTWRTEPCRHGWEFNKTEIPYATISSELGWVCDRDSYQATAQSIFFVGSILGGFIMGWISDRFGRLPAAATGTVIGGIAGVISIFATDFLQFAICRFFMGMAWDSCMLMMYLLVLEYVAPRYRTLIGNLSFAIFYSLGVCSLPWIALACNDWRMLSLVTCLPMILAFTAPFLMPESPRWLLSAGRVDDAVTKIQRIGQINKKAVPQKLIDAFKANHAQQKEEKASILELMKRPILRKTFICICVGYMCCTIVFDALARSVGQLNFDFFLSFTVVSFTEFPSLCLVSFILDWTGRKWLSVLTFGVSCVFSILTALLGGGLPSVLCAIVARFAANITFNATMQWAAEMLPTPIRGSGFAVVHICSYVATVISPFIVYLEVFYSWLPLVIVGCVAAFGAVMVLGLPETAGKVLPQSYDDAESLVLNSKLFEVPCMMKKTCDGKEYANDSFEM